MRLGSSAGCRATGEGDAMRTRREAEAGGGASACEWGELVAVRELRQVQQAAAWPPLGNSEWEVSARVEGEMSTSCSTPRSLPVRWTSQG